MSCQYGKAGGLLAPVVYQGIALCVIYIGLRHIVFVRIKTHHAPRPQRQRLHGQLRITHLLSEVVVARQAQQRCITNVGNDGQEAPIHWRAAAVHEVAGGDDCAGPSLAECLLHDLLQGGVGIGVEEQLALGHEVTVGNV